jgi:PAS domain S-box-containing protein
MRSQKPINSFLREPEPRAVLLPDNPRFTIVGANRYYLKATNTISEDIMGKGIFEAFPENPEDIASEGYLTLRHALEDVIRTGQEQKMHPIRYDIKMQETSRFKVSYWLTVCTPSYDENKKLQYIFIRVKDVTESVLSDFTQRNTEIEKTKDRELQKQAEILAKIGTWEYNLATNKIEWSDGVFRICGYEPQEFEVTPEKRMEIIHPDDREKAKAFWRELLETGEECKIEKRHITKNNTIKYITSVGKAIKDSSGKPYKLFGVYQDVTNIKLAEEQAQQRSIFIETALEHLPIGIAVNNIDDSKTVLMNAQFSKIYGWPKQVLADVNSFFEKIYPDAAYRNEISKKISEDMSSGDINRMNWDEITITTQDGEKKIVSAKNIPVYSQNLMISTVMDVTDKVASRNAILESNERYEYVTKATFDAIWDWDIAADFIFWGEGFESLFGHKLSQLKSKSTELTEYVHPDDYQKVMESIRGVIISGENNWFEEYRYKKGNGDYAYVVNKGVVIRDSKGYALRMIGAMQDVTKQKENEKKLIEATQKITNTLESIQDGFYALDKDFTVIYWNNEAERLTGRKREDILGKNLWEIFRKTNSRRTVKEFEFAIENQKPVRFVEFSKVSNKWLEIIAYPSDIGLTVYFKDIDDRKKAELKLIKINEELKAHAKELAISNEELEQFAYIASHDLQEPLRMVTSFLSQLEKKYSEILDEKGRKYIHFAVDGAKRMRLIILDLLEFSRVGKTEDSLELVDLNAILEEIKFLYRKKIEEKGATINYATLPAINFYKAPIRQVLQNLISNALKYSRENEKPVINITVTESKTLWKVEVEDNGIGIEEEYFNKIFIIFQRLHNKDEYSGTGMGLAITKKIIENIGGQIWLKSTEGKGTTFYFTIPKIKKQS